MPELEDEAKRLYEDSYGKKTYADYCDKNDTAHGRTVPETFSEMEFGHRPDHDVESIYWVLLATLLRAEPRDSLPDPDFSNYWTTYDALLNHKTMRGGMLDTRSSVLVLGERGIRSALDPKLASVAPMLNDMRKQIIPEYAYLQPAQEHLHEALRRILLRQIVKMGDDVIPLKAGHVRSLKHEYYGGSDSMRDSTVQRNVKARSIILGSRDRITVHPCLTVEVRLPVQGGTNYETEKEDECKGDKGRKGNS